MESGSNYDPESKLLVVKIIKPITRYQQIKYFRGFDIKRILWREKGDQKKPEKLSQSRAVSKVQRYTSEILKNSKNQSSG